MGQAWRLGAVSAVGIVAACAASTQGEQSADRLPRLSECPAFADVDYPELMRLADPARNDYVAQYDENIRTSVARTPLPAEAAASTTRIRLRVPASGMWAIDSVVTVWRDESGAWFVARQDVNGRAPPPMPDPVTGERPPFESQFPVRTGRVDAADAAALDAMLADPCMRHEPDRYTYAVPLVQAQDWVCVPDSSVWLAEIVELGRPVRLVGVRCENRFLTSSLLQAVLGADIAE